MRRLYGAGLGHLLVTLACLALAAYAGSFLLGEPAVLTMLIWFAGAVVAHDLVLYPLYTLADRALSRLPVPVRNHIRIPALGAGLTLLMFLPGIIRQGEDTHLAATSLDQQPYLGRWLWLMLAMFVASGLIYAIRLSAVKLGRPTKSRSSRT